MHWVYPAAVFQPLPLYLDLLTPALESFPRVLLLVLPFALQAAAAYPFFAGFSFA
jgi:hypothetical protein